jgi:hypothetical protein
VQLTLGGNSGEQSIAMRYLIAILGVLAMLVTLSGPVAALTATLPCHHESMAKAAAAHDAKPCMPKAGTCSQSCPAAGYCQSKCGPTAPFARAHAGERASLLLTMKLLIAASVEPSGTDTPVEGPPPRT